MLKHCIFKKYTDNLIVLNADENAHTDSTVVLIFSGRTLIYEKIDH